MENPLNMSPEELEQALEKAKRDVQAMMDQMTPEERERALAEGKRRIEEDQASLQKLVDDAKAYVTASAPKEKPKFCTNCGAPASGGKFCTNCGSPLQ